MSIPETTKNDAQLLAELLIAIHGNPLYVINNGLQKSTEDAIRIIKLTRASDLLPKEMISCSDDEVAAWETHAKDAKLNMETHPLHWLYLNPETYSARRAWSKALFWASKILTQQAQLRLDEARGTVQTLPDAEEDANGTIAKPQAPSDDGVKNAREET